MRYTENFSVVNLNCKFNRKKFNILGIFAQNIDRGYTLDPPQRGGSNEYKQSMFWVKNQENMYTPVNPIFTIKSRVFRGWGSLHGHVCMMGTINDILFIGNKKHSPRCGAAEGGVPSGAILFT